MTNSCCCCSSEVQEQSYPHPPSCVAVNSRWRIGIFLGVRVLGGSESRRDDDEEEELWCDVMILCRL